MIGGRGGGYTGIGSGWPPGVVGNLSEHGVQNQHVKLRLPPAPPNPLDIHVTCYKIAPMDNLPLNHTKWNDRLAFDVALTLEGSGEPLDEVIRRHNITANEILVFNADPIFLKRVASYRDEVREKGLTFRLKARAQAEELLTTSYLLIHDPAVSPAVKADLIKSTVKWAGLEPKGDVVTDSSGGVKITINLGPSPSDARVIEAPAIEMESEDAHSAEY